MSCVPDVAFRGATWYRVRVDVKGRRFQRVFQVYGLPYQVHSSKLKPRTQPTTDGYIESFHYTALKSTKIFISLPFQDVRRQFKNGNCRRIVVTSKCFVPNWFGLLKFCLKCNGCPLKTFTLFFIPVSQ